MTLYCFSAPNIRCSACSKTIDNALRALPDVTAASTDCIDKKIYVTAKNNQTFSPQICIDELELIGFEVSLISSEETVKAPDTSPLTNSINPQKSTSSPQISNTDFSNWFKGLIAGIPGLILFILPLTNIALATYMTYLIGAFSTGILFYVGRETYLEAYKKFTLTKLLTMDALFAVSTSVAWIVSLATLIFPSFGLPSLFDTALMIFGFRHIGKAIENQAQQKIVSGLNFKNLNAKDVEFVGESKEHNNEAFPADNLKVNDVIRIRAGQIVPVDGKARTDNATILQSNTCGDITPTVVKKDEKIFAGTKVCSGTVEMTVTATTANSLSARMDYAINMASLSKMPIVTLADTILDYFIYGVFGVSALSALLICLFYSPATAIQTAISVLVSACPCILGFIIPLTAKVGLVKTAQHGIILADTSSLQVAEKIDVFVFDLIGTFTQGRDSVIEAWMSEEEKISPEEVLYTLEHKLEHPKAKAIANYVSRKTVLSNVIPIPTNSPSIVRACVDNHIYTIGDKETLKRFNVDLSSHAAKFETNDTTQTIGIARGETLVGYLILKDELRPDAKATAAKLMGMGKEVWICSGSPENSVLAFAKELGIPAERVKANCRATDSEAPKIKFINELKNNGLKKVAMIGDTQNDAAAFAASDLGIVIKSQATDEITTSLAKALICSDSLASIINLITISAQANANNFQNLTFSLVYNVGSLVVSSGLLLSVGISLNPGFAAALMIVQSSLVLLNVGRFMMSTVPSLNTVVPLLDREIQPPVITAQAGIHSDLPRPTIDSRLRGNDTQPLNTLTPPINTVVPRLDRGIQTPVITAQAGIHSDLPRPTIDSRLRGNDRFRLFAFSSPPLTNHTAHPTPQNT